jgi:hypothetical protein
MLPVGIGSGTRKAKRNEEISYFPELDVLLSGRLETSPGAWKFFMEVVKKIWYCNFLFFQP